MALTSFSIRSMYQAPKGKVLLQCDLSQAESWIVAYRANEPNMKQALLYGDIHTQTAGSALFNTNPQCEHSWEKDTRKCKHCGRVIEKSARYVGKRYNHACVDVETEVLTRNGWIRIGFLNKKDEVAQFWLENQSIDFSLPLQYHEYDYADNLIHFNYRELDQLVTPNHKMPYVTNSKFKSRPASEITMSMKIPMCGYYHGGDLAMNHNMVRLQCAIQADGTFLAGKIVFHLRKERKVKRLKELLETLGIAYDYSWTKDGEYIRFSKQDHYLTLLDRKAWSYKTLGLSESNIDILLDEILFWDGHQDNKKDHKSYCSGVKQNVEVIKTLSHLRGRQAIVTWSKSGVWKVSFNRRKAVEPINRTKRCYKGKVYCLTMESGFFVIRRNGKISITGNSAYRMGPERAAEVINKDSDKPPYVTVTVAESKQFNKAWHDYYNLKNWWSEIERTLYLTRTITTVYGRSRTFYAQWGNELFKEATAFEPQSTVGDHFNGAVHPELGIEGGLDSVYFNLVEPYFCGDNYCTHVSCHKIVNQSHDSAILEVPLAVADEILGETKRYLLRPLVIGGEEFTIPVDGEIGDRMGEFHGA